MQALAPEGDGLDDVAAAAHPAVADDLELAADRVGHRRHEVEDRRRVVELAAAVVGQRDRFDAGVGGQSGVGDASGSP